MASEAKAGNVQEIQIPRTVQFKVYDTKDKDTK